MKNSTLAWCRIAKCVFALAMVCAPGFLLGADKTVAQVSTTDKHAPAYDLQIVDGELIRPDGKVQATLGNVVDALREHYTEANIILSPGLSRLKVGDLKMRAGKLVDELEGVRVACGEKFVMQTPGASPVQVDPTTGMAVGGGAPNGGLFVLREAAPAQTQRIVEAFNVGPYLEWLRQQPKEEGGPSAPDRVSVQELETIIADTLERFKPNADNQDKPDFAYHQGATLLIVIGNVDSVEIARKIVNALPGMGSANSIAVDQTTHRQAAEDAFRMRYGILPKHSLPANQGEPPGPDSQQKK